MENCCICLSKVGKTQPKCLTCSHNIHKKCYNQLPDKGKCPLCRGVFEKPRIECQLCARWCHPNKHSTCTNCGNHFHKHCYAGMLKKNDNQCLLCYKLLLSEELRLLRNQYYNNFTSLSYTLGPSPVWFY